MTGGTWDSIDREDVTPRRRNERAMKTTIAWCAALGALATATTANARLAFEETFDDGALTGWVPSADEKYNGACARDAMMNDEWNDTE